MNVTFRPNIIVFVRSYNNNVGIDGEMVYVFQLHSVFGRVCNKLIRLQPVSVTLTL